MERSAKGHAFPEGFQPIEFRFADVVAVEIELVLAIVTFDGENFCKHRLQTGVFAFRRWRIELEEFTIGIRLQLNQIGWREHLFDFPEVDSFSNFRWHCLP